MIRLGLCQCGCGQSTQIATKTAQGRVAGIPLRYVLGHNRVVVDRVAHFWTFVDRTDGCWLWTGKSCAEFGYGLIRWRNGVGRDKRPLLRAHRVSWEIANGLIPGGLFVLHRCDNPRCVRPDHLFLGTNSDNVADMHAKGRARNGSESRTHCKRGHAFTADNTSIVRGARRCIACDALRARAYRARARYA